MTAVDLTAAADVLGRAADRLEKVALDATCRQRWYRDREAVWPGEGDRIDVDYYLDNAEFIATVDPYAAAALVPALRLAAGNLHDKDWHFVKVGEAVRCCDCEEHAALLEFARRVLREEDQ